MNKLESLLTDTWIKATWDDYLKTIDELNNQKAKSYYYNEQYKIEIPPIGFDHACDHTIIMLAVHLYALSHTLNFQGMNTCSYRKTGYREAQPDASYYLGKKADLIPSNTSIVDLDHYPAPDLVIEISKTTLADDLGTKRLLYEELGVSEYWVVDVRNAQVIAFKISDQGSYRLEISQVLPGLEIAVLNEALRRTRQSNHGIVGQWLMEKFKKETE